jgi:hypothetical protein
VDRVAGDEAAAGVRGIERDDESGVACILLRHAAIRDRTGIARVLRSAAARRLRLAGCERDRESDQANERCGETPPRIHGHLSLRRVFLRYKFAA